MRVLAGGVLALVVAMGIGRFAYTPILPLMRSEAGLGAAFAGVLAASNYFGYLVGALWAAHPVWRARRASAIRWALAAVCVTTFAMGLTANGTVWLLVRFSSGVASAFVLILVSSIVLDRAARERRPRWPGILYAGVGLGIALTGVSVPLLGAAGWRTAWLGLAALGVVLCLAAFAGFRTEERAAEGAGGGGDRPHRLAYWTLMVAYFGDGVGYIIPATFIVAILQATPRLAPIASFSWVIVGLVAAPSPIVWGRLAIRYGRIRMLLCALVLLTAGVIAPVFFRNVAGAAFSALALGATFMGITTLVNLEARALFPHSSSRAIGELTAAFGVGQIVGPLIVSAIAARGGDYDVALLAAGAVLAASAATLAGGRLARRFEKPTS